MRAQRIKTGFHRIGVVLAAICVFAALGYLYEGYTSSVRTAASSLVVGVFLYALAYALGWIVAGFAGDGDRNSS